MDNRPVKSSNIAAVGYDGDTRTLEVTFKNGSIYRYANVPQTEFDSLVAAQSVGSYFSANVRGKYESQKL